MSNRRTPTTSRLAHESVKDSIYLNRLLSNMDGEFWLDVIGYENRYKISNMGRVKSLSREVNRMNGTKHITHEIIKKQRLTKNGYLTVYLAIGKKYSHKLINVLVGTHFIPNPNNKKQVNHIFGNKLDNRATSLEWTTASENILHAYRSGAMSQKGEKHASHKLNNENVLHIFESDFSSKSLSILYKVTQGSINNIRSGVTWSHLTGKKYVKQKI